MPPLFNDNQQLDKSKLVNSLANKAPRIHKAMLVLQGFNHETVDLSTLVEHCERNDITDNISMAKFSASDDDSDTKKNKRRSKKSKKHEDNGKKRRKNSSLYCSINGENKSHTSRECKFLKAKASDKDKPKYGKKVSKRSSRNLISCRQKLTTKNTSIKS